MRGFKTRKLFVSAAVLAIGAALGIAVWVYATNRDHACTEKCNILLISIDSLRADHVGAYGYKRDTTPNFDKLAEQGSLFLNTSSASFLTPVSEMSVFSGLYPTSHGLINFDGVVSDQVKTLPQYMKSNGYRTVAHTSSPEFISYPGLRQSFSQGFDSYPSWDDKAVTELADERKNPPIGTVAATFAEMRARPETPTFVWLALGSVHAPFGKNAPNRYADPEYKGVFAGQGVNSRITFAYQGLLYPDKEKVTTADVEYVRDQYDNGVRATDEYIGEVMAQLKRQKLDKKTLIIIQSEHGEDLSEHGYFAHYDVYDTGTKVPLVIIDPRNTKQKRVNSSVGSVDILPTILSITGVKIPAAIQGTSLEPIMSGAEEDDMRTAAYIERVPLWEEVPLTNVVQFLRKKGIQTGKTGAKDIAIRTEKWKYIRRLAKDRVEEVSWWKAISGNPVTIPSEELYDLGSDPQETQNVISEHADVAADLRAKLDAWYAKVGSQRQPTKSTELIQPYQ